MLRSSTPRVSPSSCPGVVPIPCGMEKGRELIPMLPSISCPTISLSAHTGSSLLAGQPNRIFQAEKPQGREESRAEQREHPHTPMMGAPSRQGEQQSPLQLPRSSHHSTRRICGVPVILLQLQDQGIYAPLQVLEKICQQPLTLIRLPPGSGSSSSGTAPSKHFQGMQSTFQMKSRESAALPAPAAAGSKKEQAAGSARAANTSNPWRLQPYKLHELLQPLKHQKKKTNNAAARAFPFLCS